MMNPFVAFSVRMMAALPAAGTAGTISLIGFDQPLIAAAAFSVAGGASAYSIASVTMKSRFLKKNALTRKDYKYIKKQLEEAAPKMARLQKTLLTIRHLPSLKERADLVRVARRIVALTKREPRRFYQAEKFYFSHLDSAVQLSEKYAFLSSQPKRNFELEKSLNETRRTLSDLKRLIEQDLFNMVQDDLDDLNLEIDVARHSIQANKDKKSLDEKWKM
ncbi:5-bromo-4-chloroindolyl phosphate hydrolysis family protein [Metabacillus indicus]|uniref:5-bromo-4-chloroindolyl phosphate hydrolysis family protein n=1 Tax=Metabacillus indicus TaxID=246786 RepID=UPI002492F79D|nr:5-bromo-4-chloroindolyl phosphate hydrolysis family protein [Metabacillus indicus]